MFLNRSFIRYYNILPAFSLTMSLIDMKGLIRRRALGSLKEANRLAGPDPIDLPNRIIEESGIFCTIVK